MKTNSLPEEADALLARAQAIATVLSEKREEVGISIEVEALLRASIEAATFAIDRKQFIANVLVQFVVFTLNSA